jgi:hypothetical protein
VADPDRHERRNAAKAEARQLGVRLVLEPVGGPGSVQRAFAYPLDSDDGADRHYLCSGHDEIELHEQAVAMLREIRTGRAKWPDEP